MMFMAGKITVDVPDCPVVQPNVMGIPSWVVGWSLAALVVLILAVLIEVAVIRWKYHEEHTYQVRDRANAAVEMAKLHRACATCGEKYEPQLTK